MECEGRFRLLPLCFFALACGCSHNPTTAELAQVYRTGMTREETTTTLGQPTQVETRPVNGWPQQDNTPYRISAFAANFEQIHNTVVQTCEMYWVPRGSVGMGIWWDYLFFDRNDRLLGFQRRFVD